MGDPTIVQMGDKHHIHILTHPIHQIPLPWLPEAVVTKLQAEGMCESFFFLS